MSCHAIFIMYYKYKCIIIALLFVFSERSIALSEIIDTAKISLLCEGSRSFDGVDRLGMEIGAEVSIGLPSSVLVGYKVMPSVRGREKDIYGENIFEGYAAFGVGYRCRPTIFGHSLLFGVHLNLPLLGEKDPVALVPEVGVSYSIGGEWSVELLMRYYELFDENTHGFYAVGVALSYAVW